MHGIKHDSYNIHYTKFHSRRMSFIFSGFRAFLPLVMIHEVFENILLTGTDMAGTQRCCMANNLLISILYMYILR